MSGLSQMGGFLTLLGASALFFILASLFGGDDSGGGDDGSEMSHGDDGPSFLSIRNLYLFGMGFGAAGAIATHMDVSLVWAIIIGCCFGLLMAAIGWLFFRSVAKQQASTNTSTHSLIGKTAVVSSYIPAGRMGQVSAHDEHGSRVYLDARGEQGCAYNEGDTVRIIDSIGHMVTVATKTNN